MLFRRYHSPRAPVRTHQLDALTARHVMSLQTGDMENISRALKLSAHRPLIFIPWIQY